jgi:hypothetical protein
MYLTVYVVQHCVLSCMYAEIQISYTRQVHFLANFYHSMFNGNNNQCFPFSLTEPLCVESVIIFCSISFQLGELE